MMFDLAQLLQPVAQETFFRDYWGQKPLLLQRKDAAHYGALLTADDFDDIISERGLRYPAVRLAKDGSFFPREAYTRDVRHGDELFTGVLDVERLFTEYCGGATIMLPALHLSWPRLAGLCAQLEGQLDHSVHTNAYLTPPQTPGFTPHYDTHDVFILQIAGTKHWRIYPPPIPLPHRSQSCTPELVLPAKPLLEFDLAAGHLLYLPRGYIHATATAQERSAHVTIGVTVYTGELVGELLHGATELAELREALPPGFASQPEVRAQLKGLLAQLAAEVAGATDQDAVIDAFTQRVRGARPRGPVRFRADGSAIGTATRLQLTSMDRTPIVEEDGAVILHLEGRRLRLPPGARPLLEAMRALPTFSPESLPGSVSLTTRLSLLRYLHGLGLVSLVPESTG